MFSGRVIHRPIALAKALMVQCTRVERGRRYGHAALFHKIINLVIRFIKI